MPRRTQSQVGWITPPSKLCASAAVSIACVWMSALVATPALASSNVAETILGEYDIDDIDAEWEQNASTAVGSERLHGCFTTPDAKLFYFRISSASQLEQLVEIDTSTQPIRVNTACSIGVGRASGETYGRPVIAYWRQYDTGVGDRVYFQRDVAAVPGGDATFSGNAGGTVVYWPQAEVHPAPVLMGLANGEIQQALPRKYIQPPYFDDRGMLLRRCRPVAGSGGCSTVSGSEETMLPESTIHSVALAARTPLAGSWGGCASPAAGEQCVHLAYEATSPADLVNSWIGHKSRLIGTTAKAWGAQFDIERFAAVNAESPISVDSDGVDAWIATALPDASGHWYPKAYRLSYSGWEHFRVASGAASGTAIIGGWPTVNFVGGEATVTYWDEYNGARIFAKHDSTLSACPSGDPSNAGCWRRLYKLVDAPTAKYEKRHATARHHTTDAIAFLSGLRRNGTGATDRPIMFTIREDQLGGGIMRSPPGGYSYSAPKIVGDGGRWVAVYRRTETTPPYASSLRILRWAPSLGSDGGSWEATDYEIVGTSANAESFDARWSDVGIVIAYRTANGDVKVARRTHAAPNVDQISPHATLRTGAASGTTVALAARMSGDAVVLYRSPTDNNGIARLHSREYYASAGTVGPELLVESGTTGVSAPSASTFDVAVDNVGALRVASLKVGTSRTLLTRTCTFPCAAWSASTTLGIAANERWMDDRLDVEYSPLAGGLAAIVTGVEYSTSYSAGKLVAHETANGSTFGATPRTLDAPMSLTYPFYRNGGHSAGAGYNLLGELRAASINLTDAQIRYVRDFPGNGSSSVHVRSVDVPTMRTSEGIRFSTDREGEGFPVVGWSDDLYRLMSICEPTVY